MFSSLEEGEIVDDESVNNKATSYTQPQVHLAPFFSGKMFRNYDKRHQFKPTQKIIHTSSDKRKVLAASTNDLENDEILRKVALLSRKRKNKPIVSDNINEVEEGELIEEESSFNNHSPTGISSNYSRSKRPSPLNYITLSGSKKERRSYSIKQSNYGKDKKLKRSAYSNERRDDVNIASCSDRNSHFYKHFSDCSHSSKVHSTEFNRRDMDTLDYRSIKDKNSSISNKITTEKWQLNDNYEQIGMDIVLSDQEFGAKLNERDEGKSTQNEQDADLEADALRAILLEQVKMMKKKRRSTSIRSLRNSENEYSTGSKHRKKILNNVNDRKETDESFSSKSPEKRPRYQTSNHKFRELQRDSSSDVTLNQSMDGRIGATLEIKCPKLLKAKILEKEHNLKKLESKIKFDESKLETLIQRKKLLMTELQECSSEIGKIEGELLVSMNERGRTFKVLSVLQEKYEIAEQNAGSITGERWVKLSECNTVANVSKISQKSTSLVENPRDEIAQLSTRSEKCLSTHSTNDSLDSALVLKERVNERFAGSHETIIKKIFDHFGGDNVQSFNKDSGNLDRSNGSRQKKLDNTSNNLQSSSSVEVSSTEKTSQDYAKTAECDIYDILGDSPTYNIKSCTNNSDLSTCPVRQKEVLEENIGAIVFSNPLFMFDSYRICPTFPYKLINHKALANKIDPFRPFCSFELFGKCMDKNCILQHERDYLMSDEEVLCSIFVHCPSLCPSDKKYTEYAHELISKNSSLPICELINSLLNTVPESKRVISACEMAARCDLPREGEDEENYLRYEMPEGLQGIAISSSLSPIYLKG